MFHEQFASDRASFPYLYRMLSGLSVYLPPETLVSPNGMAWPRDLPDLDTTLRGAYAHRQYPPALQLAAAEEPRGTEAGDL